MSRPSRSHPSLPEWAALGLLCEESRHGWAVARELGPSGEIGRVYACTRPLVYRALAQLREAGLVETRGKAASHVGPARTTLAATSRGRTAFSRWRDVPVEHVRDLRSELMLKLLFDDRGGRDPAPLLHSQTALLSGAERALEHQTHASTGFDRTLVLWRLSVVRASLSFVEALLDQRTVEPVVYRPIGLVASPHGDLDGMPLQPIADTEGDSRIEVFEAHRGCLDDLEGFSHAWVISHLHETSGWDPVVPTFLDDRTHGTFASRSPRRPNAVGLSLARIVGVEDLVVTVDGIDLLDGTPVLDLKPYVPLFDSPGTAVRSGWFEARAEGVFRRRSDARFPPRSGRA